jgi:hypothetical protein
MAERQDFQEFPPLRMQGGIPIHLRRRRGAEGGMPVLLIHGASARHETFTIPCPAAARDGSASPRSLADWLATQGMEPWLLDWRGSGLVVDELGSEEVDEKRKRFDFDRAAAHDLPAAFEFILEQGRKPPLAAVGHCMGAGILAQAIASGSVSPDRHGLTHVVLLTLGLFYEPPLDSRLKAQDHLLERLLDRRRDVAEVSPHEAFPEQLEQLYERWPDALRPHPGVARAPIEQLCDRLAFMYGTPYLERNLVAEIHGAGGEDGAELPRQFGPIPLRMYVHGARNSRRGWAAGYGGTPLERFEPPDEKTGASREAKKKPTLSARERFDELERVTLITGDRNQLWHRASIDRMFEWLRRGTQSPALREKYKKVIKRGYAHQDLLWGCAAWRDVFPDIRDGLRIPYESAEVGRAAAAARRPAAPTAKEPQESSSSSDRASTRSGEPKPSRK